MPGDVSSITFDHALTDEVHVMALLREDGAPGALLDFTFSGHQEDARLEALAHSGLPWAVLAAEALADAPHRYDWHLVRNTFRGDACKSCMRERRWREERERRRTEQRQLEATHRATHPLQGRLRDHVACPRPDAGLVSTIGVCAGCRYLLDAVTEGIVCYGSVEVAGGD
jgi:hypothetical protein